MSNSTPSGDAPASAPEIPSRKDLLARIEALEAERDGLRDTADATMREQLASLRADEERFRAMADAAPAMLWVTDADNRCVFLSRQWYEFTGQTEEEGLNFGWLQAVHYEDRDEAARRFLDAAAKRQPFSLDHRLRRKDGEYRWAFDEGRPRFDDDGQWRGYIGSVIDVHDRKLATEALRKSEVRYRTLFESIDEGFCVLQMLFDEEDRPVDYRFVEMNPAFEKHTGLEAAVGRTARQLLPGLEEHWFEIYGRVARTGESIRFENGSEVMGRWFDVFAFPVEEPASRKVALLFTDITEHRRAEQALHRSAQPLELLGGGRAYNPFRTQRRRDARRDHRAGTRHHRRAPGDHQCDRGPELGAGDQRRLALGQIRGLA